MTPSVFKINKNERCQDGLYYLSSYSETWVKTYGQEPTCYDLFSGILGLAPDFFFFFLTDKPTHCLQKKVFDVFSFHLSHKCRLHLLMMSQRCLLFYRFCKPAYTTHQNTFFLNITRFSLCILPLFFIIAQSNIYNLIPSVVMAVVVLHHSTC